MSRAQIYRSVAWILSLRHFPERAPEANKYLPTSQENWQLWVQMANRHLVLPTLFVLFKQNSLLQILPQELQGDLEYIHKLNYNRNKAIIEQVGDLHKLLSKNDMDFVIMKGVGNLLDGLYDDLGERLVYDIDILVKDPNMLKVAHLLRSAGYYTQKDFNPKAHPSTMHYPILVSEKYVSGVEIHRLPVQYLYLKHFDTQRVFDSKIKASTHEHFWVMDDTNKALHNFIHSQLMHNGHYHADVKLRDVYDLLLLSQRIDLNEVFNGFGKYLPKSKSYQNLTVDVFALPKMKGFRRNMFLWRNGLTLRMSPKQLSAYHLVINVIIKYFILPFRTLFNRNARNYVFSRLQNRHWYGQHLESYKRKFFGRRKNR